MFLSCDVTVPKKSASPRCGPCLKGEHGRHHVGGAGGIGGATIWLQANKLYLYMYAYMVV